MPMDGLTVGFAARELDNILRDGRIDKITQPERDTVVLVIRAGGANHRLLLCASPNNARCHLTMGTYSNPLEPPALCMLMRKQLTGARITEIRQVGGDRIVHVDMDGIIKAAGVSGVDSEWKLLLLVTGPFNLLKGVVLSIVTALIYKPLSPILHGKMR